MNPGLKKRRDDLGRPSPDPDLTPGPGPEFWLAVAICVALIMTVVVFGLWWRG